MAVDFSELDRARSLRKAGTVQRQTLVAIACLVVVATSLFALPPPRMVEHFAALPKAAATVLVAAASPHIPIP